MVELRGAKVLVTGGTGFLGKHLCEFLRTHYEADVVALTRKWGCGSDTADLMDRHEASRPFMWKRVDYCFHLAGVNGGIGMNLANPGDIFYKNTVMGLNALDACRRHKVKKVVSVVASCAYPTAYVDSFGVMWDQEICQEDDFLEGVPHESVACHGYAKRNLQLASYFMNQQYGLNAVCACPATLFGPGDSFDPDRTKVVGGMVKRFVDAVKQGKGVVECWGTGSPLRELLYVEDAAQLLCRTMQYYDDSSIPLNLGTGQELSIKELAELTAELTGFKGEIRWDKTKPDGQYRKRLDLTRMQSTFGSFVPTPLRRGLSETIEYYRTLEGNDEAQTA